MTNLFTVNYHKNHAKISEKKAQSFSDTAKAYFKSCDTLTTY